MMNCVDLKVVIDRIKEYRIPPASFDALSNTSTDSMTFGQLKSNVSAMYYEINRLNDHISVLYFYLQALLEIQSKLSIPK